MSREERERLQDIKQAIGAIGEHLARADDEPTEGDAELLHDALLFQFVVIGEAVKNLAAETRDSAPNIPWGDVAGLRDLIAASTSESRSGEFSKSWSATSLPWSRRSTACLGKAKAQPSS